MKFVKFGIFTLALGMFVASCGNSETPAEEVTTDSVATEPVAEAAAAVDQAALAVDSAAAALDTAKAAVEAATPAH